MKELEDTDARRTQDAPRELFLLVAGGQLFAVRAEETVGVAEGLTHAPLPHAPASVLGVASVRGRMRTVLYPPALFADASDTQAHSSEGSTSSEDSGVTTPRFVVALRGDEQLALAADEVLGVFKVNAGSLTTSDAQDAPLDATLEHEGRRVRLLDLSRLFDAAMRGTERRRPRA